MQAESPRLRRCIVTGREPIVSSNVRQSFPGEIYKPQWTTHHDFGERTRFNLVPVDTRAPGCMTESLNECPVNITGHVEGAELTGRGIESAITTSAEVDGSVATLVDSHPGRRHLPYRQRAMMQV